MTETTAKPQRVAVVGGGAVGTTLAGDLANRGVEVTLFERDTIGAGSSGRAAGICYDAYADRRDVRIAGRAIERFRSLADSFRSVPYVLLARAGDRDQVGAIESLAAQMSERGVEIDLVDADGLAADWPALRTDDVAVAAIAPNAGVLDPAAYTTAMGERARRRGVTIRTETTASLTGPQRVRADGAVETFNAVVVAAGPATKAILAAIDVAIPLEPYRAQALRTEAIDATPPTVFDATGHYYLRPWGEGVLLGDGVHADVDPTDWKRTADADFVERGRDRLETALGIDVTVDRAWAGLCTATPDRDPLVGQVVPGLFVATGWHGHGLMRSPAIAEALADHLLGGEPIPGFEPTRFDGDEQFVPVEGMTLAEE